MRKPGKYDGIGPARYVDHISSITSTNAWVVVTPHRRGDAWRRRHQGRDSQWRHHHRIPDEPAEEPSTESGSYYDELGGRLRGLVISLGNVLSSEEAADIEESIEHAEFGEALRTLAWIIVEANKQIPISGLTEIEALATLMEIAEEMPDGLRGHVEGVE
jgi:hypothetical protein